MALPSTKNRVRALNANVDPHNITNKFIGLVSWAIIIYCIVGVVTAPRLILEFTRIWAFYMVLRFIVVMLFYLIGLERIARAQRKAEASPYNDLPEADLARYRSIHHIVIIPNFKEPPDVIALSLDSLAAQECASRYITVVLAMEESERDGRAKAQQLQAKYAGKFASFLITHHPGNLPGEVPGKGANEAWAARQARRELVDRRGIPIENITVSSCDADSIFHPRYFAELTRQYADSPERHNLIWQAPLLFDNGIWSTSTSIRLLTFLSNAVQMAELSNPAGMAFPVSTYSLSLKLVDEVGYWDPAVVSEDWHMFLRCFFAKGGQLRVQPIFLPTLGNPVYGKNTWHSWLNFYSQQLRHAWGGMDMGYMFQMWNISNGPNFLQKFGRATKILHDNVIFGVGGLVTLLGTILSIILDNNFVVTIPPNTSFTGVAQVINVVGAGSMVAIWLVERLRCSKGFRSWNLVVLAKEIITWSILPFVTLVLAGFPALQAHTMMVFGESLIYERTPKSLESRAGQ